ncbi:hypothetical protein [Clostridium sp. CM028]|uniref:hypothetical protein n=1 Tax=Clostridium sp. CM028 TaxID=2851575 RepID=UPI002163124A|nr:hypothetical protein [Clostridium sp. CM028]
MKIKAKNASKKSGKSAISITLYVVASVVVIMGVALLVNNVFLYRTNFNQAVAQGYSAATVRDALVPSQLLPGIFEPVAIYGGIAFLLLGVGVVNKKVSKCLICLTKAEVCNDIVEEDIDEEYFDEEYIVETINQEEIDGKIQKA